jgi:hypothetical protein
MQTPFVGWGAGEGVFRRKGMKAGVLRQQGKHLADFVEERDTAKRDVGLLGTVLL